MATKRRRNLQFSLRTLFIAYCLVGVGSAYGWSYWNIVNIEWNAAAELRRCGHKVNSDFFQRYGLNPTMHEPPKATVPIVEKLLSRPRSVFLDSSGRPIDDEVLVQVASLHGVTSIVSIAEGINDDSIEPLCNMPSLQRLQLCNTRISLAGRNTLRSSLRHADVVIVPALDDKTL